MRDELKRGPSTVGCFGIYLILNDIFSMVGMKSIVVSWFENVISALNCFLDSVLYVWK